MAKNNRVVAQQLTERSLPRPEDPGSNQDICNFYLRLLNKRVTMKNQEKEAEIGKFWNSNAERIM